MTFFVCDIESSHVFPLPNALLTAAFVAVDEEGYLLDSLYVRMSYDINVADKDTMEWWEQQDEDVRAEAFAWERDRLHPISAATKIAEWVINIQPEKAEAIFTASPVSFDYGWINMLFMTTGVLNPFSHRTLCLRSMRFGIQKGIYGEKRQTVESQIPHHAHYDAHAAALDLQEMLK